MVFGIVSGSRSLSQRLASAMSSSAVFAFPLESDDANRVSEAIVGDGLASDKLLRLLAIGGDILQRRDHSGT